MKSHINILSIFLCFIILFYSIFSCSFVVYASSHGGGGISSPERGETFGEWCDRVGQPIENIIYFIVCQTGAVVSKKDFSLYLKNHNALYDYIAGLNASDVVSDDGTYTFPSDLVALIKQALKEYAEETCGFITIPTVSIKNINPNQFIDYNTYYTAKSLAEEYGYIGIKYVYKDSRNIGYYYVDMSPFLDGSSGFYIETSNASGTYYVLNTLDFKTWAKPSVNGYYICSNELDSTLKTWEDVIEFCEGSVNSGESTSNAKSWKFHISNASSILTVNSGTATVGIVSPDGRRILVFNSKDALINYSVDHRTIYFGSGFYEESGSITGSFDEMQDWLDGKYDDMLDRIQDMIGDSNLSEEEIEKIVDKILGQLGDIKDEIEKGNEETNSLLENILEVLKSIDKNVGSVLSGDFIEKGSKKTNSLIEDMIDALNSIDDTVASALSGLEFSFDTSGIEEYLAGILDDLDLILINLEDLTADNISDKSDSLFFTLISAFSEVGDVAKHKFPLSIPWDVYSLLTFLGGERSPSAYAASSALYIPDSGIALVSGSAVNDYTVSPYAHVEVPGAGEHDGGFHYREEKTSDAPVFEIPFNISDSLELSGTLSIDLSDFDVLSSISHTLFTLIFCYNLLGLTFKVITLGKELIE